MKLSFHLACCAVLTVLAKPYYTITALAPDWPQLNGKIINAIDRSFIIGAQTPKTYCPARQSCPAGNTTMINEQMTLLAVGRIDETICPARSGENLILLTCAPVRRSRRSVHLCRPGREGFLPPSTLGVPPSRIPDGRLPCIITPVQL